MTLLYKLLGRPGNEEEFIKMMKRKGISVLDITLEEAIHKDKQSRVYQCFPVLRADGRILNLRDYLRERELPNNSDGDLEKLAVEEKVFKRILFLANDYQKKGFKVTIVGKPVEEARQIFDDYFLRQKTKLIPD